MNLTQHRINTTITELTIESDGENILMVSHGAAIAQFYRYWLEYNEVRQKDASRTVQFFIIILKTTLSSYKKLSNMILAH